MSATPFQEIMINQIRRDGGTQPRAGLNTDTVQDYVDAMSQGDKFPNVTVFYDGTDYWLADGFHRVEAAQRSGAMSINADVRQGTQRDAILFSVGANATHGLTRSREDKRRAVLTMLNDDEWFAWSDHEIARRCGVSHPTVASIRKETGRFSSVRTTSDGRSMNTENIGKNQTSTAPDLTGSHTFKVGERVKVLGNPASMSMKRDTIGTIISLDVDTAIVRVIMDDAQLERLNLSLSRLLPLNADVQPDEQIEDSDNPFKVGERVGFVGGWREPGPIRYIKGSKCGVFNEQSRSTHYYEWAELFRVDDDGNPAGDESQSVESDQPFPVGSKVLTRANHIGTIRGYNGAHVIVETATSTTVHHKDSLKAYTEPKPSAPPSDDSSRVLVDLYDLQSGANTWIPMVRFVQLHQHPFLASCISDGKVVELLRVTPTGGLMKWYQITPAGCARIQREPLPELPAPADDQYPDPMPMSIKASCPDCDWSQQCASLEEVQTAIAQHRMMDCTGAVTKSESKPPRSWQKQPDQPTPGFDADAWFEEEDARLGDEFVISAWYALLSFEERAAQIEDEDLIEQLRVPLQTLRGIIAQSDTGQRIGWSQLVEAI